MEGEAVVTAAGLALGTRQRIFLVGARVEEDRKILADRPETGRQHGFRACADDHVIAVGVGRPSSSSRTAPPTI